MDRLDRGPSSSWIAYQPHHTAKKNNRTESNLDGSCQIYPSARASRSAIPSRMGRAVSSGGSSGPFMTRCSRWCLSALHGSHVHLSGCVSSLAVSSASIWFDIATETRVRPDLRVSMAKRVDRLARGSDTPRGAVIVLLSPPILPPHPETHISTSWILAHPPP